MHRSVLQRVPVCRVLHLTTGRQTGVGQRVSTVWSRLQAGSSLHGLRAPSNQHKVLFRTLSAAQTDQPVQTAADTTAGTTAKQPSWDIKMLYDGDCPLCMREVNMLRRRDEGKGRICFVDIAADSYVPQENAGISFEQAMGSIHAILPDGRTVQNVEVFRRLYEAVGLGWVYAITKVQPFGAVIDWVYGIWAKYRLPITGRPDMEVILQQRQRKTCRDG